MLKEIFPFIKKNFILIIRKIINEINEKEDRKYFLINEVYLKKINQILKEYCDEEISEKEIISNIIDNSKTSTEYIKIILTQYQTENKIIGKELTILFNNISKLPNVAINEFFYDKILYIIDKEGSITNISKLNNIQISNNIKEPYIITPSNKKYSLVIDLDETLVFVKFINNNSNKALLHLRPYLFDFLENLYPLYELISFTTATSIYAEKILNEIEAKKKYFSYKFYREHAIIRDKNLIKDISRIGRDMSKILLVDNMSHNFYLNEDNGILIYPFYNENNQDTSLLELKRILITIYYKNYEDIRVAIKDFKNEIIMKVSCNINSFNKKKIK
jgi:Dullard-like phosphatase family protein